jgi:uncharacterized protein (DUF2236 family)
MLWVWATLVDTGLAIYERFVEGLDADARRAYYADHRSVARVLGVPGALVPPSWEAFRSWFDGMLESDALAVTPAAREIARPCRPPRHLRRARPAPDTAGLLPPRARDSAGLGRRLRARLEP